MLFNSLEFFVFFPVVVLLYFVMPRKIKNLWLLASSYAFYMYWSPKFILLIVFDTLVSFFCGLLIPKSGEVGKKVVLTVGIALELSTLLWFKFGPLLPVGISFFTFQTLSYMIDVYRGDTKSTKNIAQYALFVAFFPQLLAGPIGKSKELLAQFQVTYAFEYQRVKEGLLTMVWGFFQKLVIADRIKIYVDAVYADIPKYSGWYLILATVLFSFQLYCDFAGYSTIAVGAAKVIGVRLTENFDAPFFSMSVAELWRRWHISLSTWFRDYLYFPLGGSRKGKLRKYANLMVVYLVSGLWHGADLSFVLWGAWNGVFRIFGEVTAPIRAKLRGLVHLSEEGIVRKVGAMLMTFLLFTFTMVYFRADNLAHVGAVFAGMVDLSDFSAVTSGAILQAGLNGAQFVVLALALGALFVADLCRYRKHSVIAWVQKRPMALRWAWYLAAVFAVILFGIYGDGSSGFIYFAF
jgi:D-alanyl-lipoteichoic acid acyltransferase DltB (MBOAT superfamily)